jgi:hypothetical protein
MKVQPIKFRLLYALGAFVVVFYACMVPIVLVTGWWALALYRPLEWFGQAPHLAVICAAWIWFGSRRSAFWTAAFATTLAFLFSQILSHWSLFTDHDWKLWFAMIMILVGEPALTLLLLGGANEIAPRIMPNWDPSYAR